MEEARKFFEIFFSSQSDELKSQVNRLDILIGRDHWLSVGNYKESILRQLLANILPRKYEVSTGFILAADSLGEPIKSKQIDILIWDSYNYAPVFRDGEFVIVPPEACKAVIEVKSKFRKANIIESLQSADAIFEFVRTPLLPELKIKKYIFYFDTDPGFSFPKNVFDGISDYYLKQAAMPMIERLKCINSKWPQNISWSLFSVDAVFVMGKGVILRSIRRFNDSVRIIFEAYKTCEENTDIDYTYSFFEHEIHRSINTIHDSGLYYVKQAGMQSIARHIKIEQFPGEWIMILPFIKSEDLWQDFQKELIYKPSLS
jgi:hypothetical protein